jgi:ATP-dependent 26S proteasome regulatory subunit
MAVNLQSEVLAYLKAGFPCLVIQTHEEDRAVEQITDAAKEIKRQVISWTCTKGFQKREPDGKIRSIGQQPIDDPRSAVEFIGKQSGGGQDDTVYVLKDFHAWIEDPMVTRAVRDTIPFAKATGRTLCIVAPKIVIPTELEKDMTLITLDLPTTEHLGKIFDGIVESVGTKQANVENRDKMLEAGKGLSAFEAEQTYSFALVKHGDLSNKSLKTVMREKAGVIKKTGIMEFYEPDADMSAIGGHDTLKKWLKKRARAFTPKAKTYGLDEPKGVLIVGVQGCGKSMLSKAIANEWMLPLLRLDVGRVFGALVGQSEENMRKALAIAEAVSPCVVWLDELEKGLAGLASSGQTDSGVTARVFGTLLTWMSERKSPVFIVATCNDINSLPAEMIRKGRFDEIWFADLPTQTERATIFEIHIKKRGRDPKKFNIGKLAMLADQFSGAEIEEAIKSAMFDAFDEDKEVTTEHIVRAVETSPPLAQTAPEKIKKVRDACDANKWRRSTEVVERAATGRKIEA